MTFDNVYPGFNDNVAMGDNCQSRGVDFVDCTGVDRMSYDWYPERLTSPLSIFVTDSADLIVDTVYSGYEWTHELDNHSASKMLCHYMDDPFTSRVHYDDNVGYDTLTSKQVARQTYDLSNHNRPHKIHITTFPNPFNSAIQISVSSTQTHISIFDLRGNLVAEFPNGSTVIWRPVDLPAGMYIIRAKDKGEVAQKTILYLK